MKGALNLMGNRDRRGGRGGGSGTRIFAVFRFANNTRCPFDVSWYRWVPSFAHQSSPHTSVNCIRPMLRLHYCSFRDIGTWSCSSALPCRRQSKHPNPNACSCLPSNAEVVVAIREGNTLWAKRISSALVVTFAIPVSRPRAKFREYRYVQQEVIWQGADNFATVSVFEVTATDGRRQRGQRQTFP